MVAEQRSEGGRAVENPEVRVPGREGAGAEALRWGHVPGMFE